MEISTENLILFILLILIFVLIVIMYYKLMQIRQTYKELLTGVDKGNLEDILKKNLEKVNVLNEKIIEVDKSFNEFKNKSKKHIQKIGFKRFNPFHETGGDQSFVFVLLNAQNSGAIISSFHQREVTRVYAKNIFEGEAKQKLSKEEEEVLQQAINS